MNNYNTPIPFESDSVCISDKFYLNSQTPADLFTGAPLEVITAEWWSMYDTFILENAIQKLVEDKFRTYSDILRGERCYNEYLFFKIEKWLGDAPFNQPSQIYYVPATRGFVDLIDTQIKANETYTYRVTGYSIIVGNSITFENLTTYEDVVIENLYIDEDGNPINPQSGGADKFVSYFDINNEVSMKIKETRLFQGTTKTVIPAPLPPHVSFHNKSDSSNQVKIFLSQQFGREYMKNIGIEPTDAEQFNYVQGENGHYLFEYNKQQFTFEIFRTDEKPYSYNDFSDKDIGSFANVYQYENMLITDYVQANKKYYYTFRVKNGFHHVSNPTAVYEVELLKDADESKVVVKAYDFENQKMPAEEPSRGFRNLFQIVPSMSQIDINESVFQGLDGNIPEFATFAGRINKIEIGSAEVKLWGRKFKLRIKSKDTGKVIDFNVKFNLIKNKSESDFYGS